MLLRGLQVTIPLAYQSKFLPMNLLRKASFLLRPPHCAILGRFVRIRTACLMQAAGHFSFFDRHIFARDSARCSRL